MKTKHLQHLYLRAGFGIRSDELNILKTKPKEDIVSNLFFESKKFKPLDIDLSEINKLKSDLKGKKKDKMAMKVIQKESRKKVNELNYEWIARLNNTDAVLREKMTLFWANVFVCSDKNIWFIQRYNNMLRKNALGNFRSFVKEMAKEPSMNKYLSNKQNIKQSPNENFARELMELFTLGIGNYTEQDIKESARAFTGWSFNKNGDYFLRKKKHDFGEKTFMGKTGNFDGDDIIDIILEQKQCSRFICDKAYRYFVNPKVNENRLEELTDLFYKDYDINNLMMYIFKSDWFYDEENIGVKIKSPIELLVGIKNIVPVNFKKERQQMYLQKMMGQVLLYPPNVAGWKGNRSWIDSNTLMFRLKLASVLLNKGIITLDEKGDLEDSYENYYSTKEKRGKFLKLDLDWDSFDINFAKVSPSEMKEQFLVSEIDKDTEALLFNLKFESKRDYCVQLMSVPEYQLC
jgi:uncharacterized protein (DUF1800 family)